MVVLRGHLQNTLPSDAVVGALVMLRARRAFANFSTGLAKEAGCHLAAQRRFSLTLRS
jgi:hypothetical protein